MANGTCSAPPRADHYLSHRKRDTLSVVNEIYAAVSHASDENCPEHRASQPTDAFVIGVWCAQDERAYDVLLRTLAAAGTTRARAFVEHAVRALLAHRHSEHMGNTFREPGDSIHSKTSRL